MIRTSLRPFFGQRFQRTFQRSLAHRQPDDAKTPPANNEQNPQQSQLKHQQQQQRQHTSQQPPPPPPPPPPSNRQLTVSTASTFENVADKNRSTYLDLVRIFETQSVHRRNHVEFIYAALRHMDAFGVQRDIEVYKALMNVLPKGKYIPTNIIQSEFMHYPKQQQVIIDLLEQMEDNAVIPDHEMQDILLNTFGRRGHPVLKYWRMLYWMPKFKNASPWLLPDPVPDDSQELARLAIERMGTVDLRTEVRLYDTADVEGAIDRTWIWSGMSAEQRDLLRNHGQRVPLRVEGPFVIWLRQRQVYYFLLRGDADEKDAEPAVPIEMKMTRRDMDGE